jgi:peptide deformylase
LALLPVKIYGEEILRRKALPVDKIDGNLLKIAKDLKETMIGAKGLGLAANQIGEIVRIFAINLGHFDVLEDPQVLINPEIIEFEGSVRAEEGCLSLPGLYQMTDRAERVVYKALDLKGKEKFYEARGLKARVVLHEIDHLEGILFIDRLSLAQRRLIKGKLDKIKADKRQ